MYAAQEELVSFLSDKTRFSVPIYQRSYQWSEEQCSQLWNDVVAIATSVDPEERHFFGAFVCMHSKGPFSTRKALIVDGQQRMASSLLLLLAIGKAITLRGGTYVTEERIKELFLIYDKNANGAERYKLTLSHPDQDDLVALIEGHPIPASQEKHLIVKNYRLFETWLKTSNLEPEIIYQGMERLSIVELSIDKENPQLVFESLNSTGLDLSETDKIRNLILMGLDSKEQEDLYKRYWLPMETMFAKFGSNLTDSRFIRDYLTIKNNGEFQRKAKVYSDFKSYVRNHQPKLSSDCILADMHNYAIYFVQISDPNGVTDVALKTALAEFRELQIKIASPLLLVLFADYSNGKLSKNDLIAILHLIESYILRRRVCGFGTNAVNYFFARFAFKMDRTSHLKSLSKLFSEMPSGLQFPTDDEFAQAFKTYDFYHFQKKKYFFGKLENFTHQKEKITTNSYSIEHVMPQNENLSNEWKTELGTDWKQIQHKYLHTIGNLTLTGYNAEYSDRPFHEKRDMTNG